MELGNKKANFYIDEEILETIDEICQSRVLGVLNTICEINDYDNFISMDERKSFAITESEKHVLMRKNAEIVKHLEDKKAGRSS